MTSAMPVQSTTRGFPMKDGPDGDFDRLHVDAAMFAQGEAANLATPPNRKAPLMTDRRYASPPCLAHEIDPAYFDPLATDPQQAADVARWRKAERARLLAARQETTAEQRNGMAGALAAHLDALIAERVGTVTGRVISVYWPIKAELNLRFWMNALHDQGARVALPVVEEPGQPLIFRHWTPETRMERGHWKIPVPPATAQALIPEVTLAPLVGWDEAGFRLGYGGGYFDRTLAALSPRPFVIGVGVQSARIATIFPQPYDIAMSVIVTEEGRYLPPEAS